MSGKKPAEPAPTPRIEFIDPAFIERTDAVGAAIRRDRELHLRDEFAAAALTGMIAAISSDNALWSVPEQAAHSAYEYADAMLEARKK